MPDISDEPDRLEWVEGTPLALLVGRSEQEPSDSRCLLVHVVVQLTENFIKVIVIVVVIVVFYYFVSKMILTQVF